MTEKNAHDRICKLLRDSLAAFKRNGVAIIPRHQFKLNEASPSGHWPAVSYHTTGNAPGWWHMKDGPIPNYFSLDPRGYAGWSSVALMPELPPQAMSVPIAEVEETWAALQKSIVLSRKSKYAQSGGAFVPPPRPFLFMPTQIPGDTVESLAYLSSMDMMEALTEWLPQEGMDLVIKRHPKCVDVEMGGFIQRLAKRRGVYVTTADIHDIIPRATAIVTVNSGVGFESLLYGKRVITAGKSDYAMATDVATTMEELKRAVQGASTPPDLEKIKRFVHFYTQLYLFNSQDFTQLEGRLKACL